MPLFPQRWPWRPEWPGPARRVAVARELVRPGQGAEDPQRPPSLAKATGRGDSVGLPQRAQSRKPREAAAKQRGDATGAEGRRQQEDERRRPKRPRR